MTAYFDKSNASSPVLGVPYPITWTRYGDNESVAEVTDDRAIALLRDKHRRGVGGIVEITAEQYAEKKTIPAQPRKLVTLEEQFGTVREAPNPLNFGRKPRPEAAVAADVVGAAASAPPPQGSVQSAAPVVGSLSQPQTAEPEPE